MQVLGAYGTRCRLNSSLYSGTVFSNELVENLQCVCFDASQAIAATLLGIDDTFHELALDSIVVGDQMAHHGPVFSSGGRTLNAK